MTQTFALRTIMARNLILVLLLALANEAALGQGTSFNDIALGNSNGTAKIIPYASVLICAPTAIGVPCSPKANIYTDDALSIAKSNPFLADANGNFNFHASGAYLLQVSSAQYGVFTYPIYVSPDTVWSFNTFLGTAHTWSALQTFSSALITSLNSVGNSIFTPPMTTTQLNNEFGQVANIYSPFIVRPIALASNQAGYHSNNASYFYMENRTGGLNQTNGPWQTAVGLRSTCLGKSPGWCIGIDGYATHYSHGDTVGGEFFARCAGGTSAGDDEGCESIRAHTQQHNIVFTAVVTSLVDNGTTQTINYNGAVNEHVRGEQRYLINTNAAKSYTTGTIASVAGVPPTITLAGGASLLVGLGVAGGTTWTATNESFCFSSVNDDNGALKLVVPIKEIVDATNLILNYQYQTNDQGWTGATSGNYRIYPCTYTQTFADIGSLTVSKGSVNWAALDQIEMPLDFDGHFTGARVIVDQKLPSPSYGPVGIELDNVSTKLFPGSIGIYIPGPLDTIINVNSTTFAGPTVFSKFSKSPSYYMLSNDGLAAKLFTFYKAGPNGYDVFGYAGGGGFYFGETLLTPKISLNGRTGAVNAGVITGKGLAVDNEADSPLSVNLKAGVTADQVIAINIQDHLGTIISAFYTDIVNDLVSFGLASGGGIVAQGASTPSNPNVTYIQSQGSKPVIINGRGTTGGTGGLEVWSGGAFPSKVAGINGSGNATVNSLAAAASIQLPSASGTTLSRIQLFSDAPGAITVNAGTCTDRSIATTFVLSTAAAAVAAAYALEANIVVGGGHMDTGTAVHYRICNVQAAGNITLSAASNFNVMVVY